MDSARHKLAVAVVVAAAALTSCPLGPGEDNVPPPPSTLLVSRAQLVHEPGGRRSPVFIDSPAEVQLPLRAIRSLIPRPLPSPIDQTCTGGTDVVLTLGSGDTVTFGPCKLPPSIERLKQAMLDYLRTH